MKNNNVTDKIVNDLKTVSIGLSLLKSELQEQSQIDETIVSDKSKHYIYLLHQSINYLANDIIPDKLSFEEGKRENKVRNANDKIREMELKLGEKVSPSDICYNAKIIKKKTLTILSNFGVYSAVNVSFNEHSINLKFEFIKQKTDDGYNVSTQDEIDQIKLINKNHRNMFKDHFDVYEETPDQPLSMLLTDRNINKMKEILKEIDINFEINSLETDRFTKNALIIDSISVKKNIDNIHLDFSSFNGSE